ncbi:MAG: cytochrome [Hyphomicrobiales bacterium]|nr:cytochrome [Hyphomicrobiales bacterium]
MLDLVSGQSGPGDQPEEEIFDLYSDIDADPFPRYARLREEAPCYWTRGGQAWVLTRYDDVLRAAQDWETFSSREGNLIDEIPGRAGGTLGTTDPPRHDRLRALAQAAFMKKNIEHLVEPTRRIANTALDRILDMRQFDYVSDYSSLITVGILFQLLGLPEQNPAEIRDKVVLSVSTDRQARGRNPQLDAAFQSIVDFIGAEVTARRKSPQDDLVTRLAEAEIDGDRLTEREVVLTTGTFVMAGVESLSSFMSVFALNLHDYPDARARCAADFAVMPKAIEESLRFNTSAQRFKRVVAKETHLHGQVLTPGQKVILAYGAANRDWRKFPNPDVYDMDRNPQGHLGFGSGKHFCLGSQMARLITQVATETFLARVPNYRLTRPDVKWVASSNFRSPKALPFEVV